jgi:ribonuclease VapC
MILDSSALIAILRLESGATLYAEALDGAERVVIASPTYVEACIVNTGLKGIEGKKDVDDLLAKVDAKILPFSAEAADIAVQAYIKYGKGRGHPAQLNFGDCISYAMSKIELMPLLFKGDDFRHTDVEAAL